MSIVVAGAPALAEQWLYPLSTINLASALQNTAVLLIAGSRDSLIPRANTDTLNAALPLERHQLHIVDSDHRLPVEYSDLAFDWINQRLKR